MARAWTQTIAMMVALTVGACEVGTIPADGGARPDGGPPPPVDAGRPDSGPPPDAGPRLDDVLIYAHSEDTLFEFSPYSNTVTEIGVLRLEDGSAAPSMLDLAVNSDGQVFMVSHTTVFLADPETARLTPAMTYREDFDPDVAPIFGLSFIPPDQSPSGREILIGATNSGELYEIDLLTDRLIRRGQYPDNWGSSGDITSVEGLGTFATLRQRDARGRPIEGEPDAVAEIELRLDGNASVRIIGTTRTSSGTTFTALFGLGYWGRNLYGFSRDGELLQIDRETAITTVVTDRTGSVQFFGAGVTTKVPFLF